METGKSKGQSPTPIKEAVSESENVSNNIVSQLVQALQSMSRNSVNDKLSVHNTIPEFDPARKEQTIVMWLHKVNECAVIYNWTDKQTIHFALPKLKGLAQKWYEGLSTVLFTWQEWQEKLKFAFPCSENYGQLLTTMLARRARFNDSLEEYFYEKISLLNRCGIEGKKAVECIIFGIEDRSLRLSAEAARFESPDQLLPYLKNIRVSVPYDRRKGRNDTKEFNNAVKDGTKDRTIIKCYNCHQEGHYRSQCSKPVLRCEKCSRYGHSADKCRTATNAIPGSSENFSSKPVMVVSSDGTCSSKYYKQAFLDDKPIQCFIDFGSTATMISNSAAISLSLKWTSENGLPVLRGFGNSVVAPLGMIVASLTIDSVSASVQILVVADDVMRVPLIVGQSFTEQSHIIVQKDCDELTFSSIDYDTRIKLYCSSDCTVAGSTLADVQANIMFTGDVFIETGGRFEPGREYCLMSGLFSISNGRGSLFIKGTSRNPFTLKAGSLIARCKRAIPEVPRKVEEVLKVETWARRPIVDSDIITDGTLDASSLSALSVLLNKYRGCFAFDLHELGKTGVVEMEINLKDSEPVSYRPYRLPYCEREKVREMVSELLDCGIIQPSTSSYSSPIVLVKKKTGDVRLCVDFRALNRKTIKENYPLPRIDDQLDELAGYSFYTTLDLASGYYQIQIKESDRHKTSFVTPDAQYEFTRMPFGLVNAPSTFMRMINLVLSNIKRHQADTKPEGASTSARVATAYMDDIIIPSVSLQDGLERLEVVLEVLQNANLTLKLQKCCFFSKTVDYLGFEVSGNGIRPGSRKVDAVVNFPTPADVHNVRQFIGLCSFFRRFVRSFSIIARPLTALLKKDATWQWGKEQVQSFDTLKEELSRKPVLALYDPKAPTELHTDACKIGIAGILMQRNKDGILRPIAYYSRQTTKEEMHMTAYELETLAVIASLQKFRVYLIGIEFKVVTDCNSLRATFLKRDLIPRVARWWISMQEYNISIEYRPGKSMAHVDALSRNPSPNRSTVVDGCESIMEVTESEFDWLSTVQTADTELQRKISILKDPATDNIVDIKNNYVVRNGKLYYKTDLGEKWVVPKGVRWQILKQCHDDIGHFAFDKTLSKIKETYWFPKMRRFVKKYVESCLECAYAKSSLSRKPPLHPIEKKDIPFDTLHIDHVGPFVKSSKGNSYLLVIVDAYTKFLVMKPVKTTKTSMVIDKMREYFSIFGIPKRIISDRGSCFTSIKFKDFLSQLGVRHVLNAVATPRANGQVERYNRTLLDALTAKCIGSDEKKWDAQVPDIQLGLNNTINKGIGKTPSQALFGTTLIGTTEGRVKLYLDNDCVNDTESLDKIREEINEYIVGYQDKQKAAYDKKACTPALYSVGDLVSIEREIQSTGQSRKLIPKFQGPYRVVEVLGNDRYRIEDTPITKKGNRKYSAIIAVDKMKRWMSFSRSRADSSSSSNGEDNNSE